MLGVGICSGKHLGANGYESISRAFADTCAPESASGEPLLFRKIVINSAKYSKADTSKNRHGRSERLQENRAANCRKGGFVPRVAWLH